MKVPKSPRGIAALVAALLAVIALATFAVGTAQADTNDHIQESEIDWN